MYIFIFLRYKDKRTLHRMAIASSLHKISFQWSCNYISYTKAHAGNMSLYDVQFLSFDTETLEQGVMMKRAIPVGADCKWPLRFYTLYVQYAV